VKLVDASALPDPIDTPDPLLEPDWRPRQLEIDDEAASVLQVEAFASGIRRQQDACVARCELTDDLFSFAGGEPSVELEPGEPAERGGKRRKRVAVCGEDDRRLTGAVQQAANRTQLAFVSLGAPGECEDALEYPALIFRIGQSACAECCLRLFVAGIG
jgi:hypothetical protein